MIVGPFLGGVFVDFLSWRFAFLINVVPIAVTMWLLVMLGHRDHRREGATVDWIGGDPLHRGARRHGLRPHRAGHPGDGPPRDLGGPCSSASCSFAGFLVRQRFARDPMMPLDLFRVRNFWTGNMATAFVYAALSLNGLVVAVYLQQGAGPPCNARGPGEPARDAADDPAQPRGRERCPGDGVHGCS